MSKPLEAFDWNILAINIILKYTLIIPTHIYLPSCYSNLVPIPIFICIFLINNSLKLLFSSAIIQHVNEILSKFQQT